MKLFLTITSTLILLCIGAAQAQATVIVSPNANFDVDGPSANQFPFLTDGEMRYQQVYSAGDFGAFSGPEICYWIS